MSTSEDETTPHTDAARTIAQIEPWLSQRYGRPTRVVSLSTPGASGYSSETLLLDVVPEPSGATDATGATGAVTGAPGAHAGEPGAPERLVLRAEPTGFRAFPDYDLALQVRCMEAVAAASQVPVPRVRWHEPDAGVIGRPFFVMDRVEGEVPPDNLPYTIDGFLVDASPADQGRLYRSAVEVLADIHAIDVERAGLGDVDPMPPDTSRLEHHLDQVNRYLDFATGGAGHHVLDRVLSRLLRDRPADRPADRPVGLSWGDARLGNMVVRDFEVVAVLDWEMATLAVPEVDAGWFFYFIRCFSDVLGLPNLPGFPAEAEGIAIYEARAGRPLEDMDWYLAWAALRYAAIMVRLMHRPDVMAGTPDEWTVADNPWVQAAAAMAGVAV